MALELLETLKESITAYTGLSPTTFFTVVALGLAIYYVISGMFGGSSDHHVQPLPPPVQLGEVTEEELKAYDGNDPKKPLLMAIKGQIYDVSQSSMFYGPGGPYALFAGKDASRALATMSFDEKDLTGDISGLGMFEMDALRDWEYKFMSKYAKVGTIKTAEPAAAPESSTSEPVVAAKPAESSAPGPTDSSAAKHTEPSEPEVAADKPKAEVFLNTIRHNEKWKKQESYHEFAVNTKRSKTSSTCSFSSYANVGFDMNAEPEDDPFPPGRDQAKRKLKAGSSNTSNRSEDIAKLNEQIVSMHTIKLMEMAMRDISSLHGIEYKIALLAKKDAAKKLGYDWEDDE